MLNIDFSEWENGKPKYWVDANSPIYNKSTVTISNTMNGVGISTNSPCVGLEQSVDINSKTKVQVILKNNIGSSFINLMSNDDININYSLTKENKNSFTHARGVNIIRFSNGNLVKFLTLSNVGETQNSGGIYMIEPSGVVTKLYDEPNCQQLIAEVTKIDNTIVILYHKIDTNGSVKACILYSSDEFKTITQKQLLAVNYEYQAYSIIKASNGILYIPYLKKDGNANRYSLDIMYGTSLASFTQLNQFKTISTNRGLMESKAIEISGNKLCIVSRTESGYLAKNILDLNSMILSDYSLTTIATSSTTFDIKTLSSGKHLITWSSSNSDLNTSTDKNYPRMFICVALTNDDLSKISCVQLVTTNKSVGANLSDNVPYTHSPMIDIIDDRLYITFEAVYFDKIDSYTAETSITQILNNDYTNNDINSSKTFQVELPIGMYRIQFLSCVSKSSNFIVSDLMLPNNNEPTNEPTNVLYLRLLGKNIKIPFSSTNDNYISVKTEDGVSKIKLNTDLGCVFNDNYTYTLQIKIGDKIKNIIKIS